MAARSKKLLKVIDGIRSWNISTSQTPSNKACIEIEESLRSENFQVGKVAIHGFPHQPTCMAFDPVQKIVAIGTKTGVIRMFGRPGVDYVVSHPSSSAVVQIIFLVNEGGLISICQDDVVHLWNIRQKNPELVHSLQFKREHLTCGHVPVASTWLYLGTDKGNVHFVNVQRFTTSGYVINWNKAIDLSQSAHPGRVVQVAENPQDSNKLLIGYASGFLVLWDLRTKAAEARFKHSDSLNGFSWHWEGKNFLTCHNHGMLAIWSYRQPNRPTSVYCPHAGGETLPDDYTCYEPIHHVEWLPCKNGESLIVFAGGARVSSSSANPGVASSAQSASAASTRPEALASSDSNPVDVTAPGSDLSEPHDTTSPACVMTGSRATYHTLSVKRGKRLVVMQMDHRLIDVISLCASPFVSEFMEPYAVAVLLQHDLVVVDLLSPNYAIFENPYPMDLHSSPVTACLYLVDCPGDLVPAFYSVGSKSNRSRTTTGVSASGTCSPESDTFSSREWPITGGEWGMSYNPYPELVLTGHADGSVRFWDASEVTLTPLYKVRTLRFFDTSSHSSSAGQRKPDRTDSHATAGQLPSPSGSVNGNYSSVLLDTEDDPFAIRSIHFCPDSRLLLTASSTHVCLMHFCRREQTYEIPVMDINMAFESLDDLVLGCAAGGDAFADDQVGSGPSGTMTKETAASQAAAARNVPPIRPSGSVSSAHSGYVLDRNQDLRVFVPLRTGHLTWSAGYQPALVCRLGIPALGFDFTTGATNDPSLIPPPPVSSAGLNSHYGLLAIGNEYGIVLLDYVNRICLLSTSISDICGPSDLPPRPQVNRSPGRAPSNSSGHPTAAEATRPTVDQPRAAKSPQPAPVVKLAGYAWPLTSDATVVGQRDHTGSSPDPSSCCGSCDPVKNERDIKTPELKRKPPRPHSAVVSRHKSKRLHSERNIVKPPPGTAHRTLPPSWGLFTFLDLSANGGLIGSGLAWIKQLGSPGSSGDGAAYQPQLVPDLLCLKRISPLLTALVLAYRTSSALRQQFGQDSSHAQTTLYASGEKCSDLGQSSYSCSLSTSTSSLEQFSAEGVRAIAFMDSYARRTDPNPSPCLWIGTTRGNVLAVHMNLSDIRTNQAVNSIVPSGSIFRVHGEIVHIGFLDLAGDLMQAPTDKWDESLFVATRTPGPLTKQTSAASSAISSVFDNSSTSVSSLRQGDASAAARRLGTGTQSGKERKHGPGATRNSSSSTSSSSCPSGSSVSSAMHSGSVPTQGSMAGTADSPSAGATGLTETDKQLLVICSEKQARVVALPSQTCLYKVKITETSSVVRASIQRFRASTATNNDASGTVAFLACYLANGHFVALSLPSLRHLMDVDYLPMTDCVARSFAFGQHGQAVYLTSPSELLKITWAADMCANLRDMQGELFLPCNMPEPPKKNFFKNLLSGNLPSSVDRDELFGESASGKSMPGTSTLLPSTRMDKLAGQASAGTSEIARARNAAIERGERLGQLDLQTQEMMDQAKGFGRQAAMLAAKYEKKDKRWGWPL